MIGYGRLNVALPSLPGFYWVWPSRSTDWKIKKNNNNQIDDDLLAVSMDLHGRHLIFSLNLSLSLSLCLTGPRLSEIYRVIAVCPDVSVTAVDQVVTAAKHFSFHTNLAGFTDSIYWFERAPKKLGQSQLFVLFFFQERKRRSIHQDTIRSSLPTADWIRVFVGPTAQIHGLDSFYRDSLVVRLD